MMSPISTDVSAGAARSMIYRTFATALSYPNEEKLHEIRAGVVGCSLWDLLGVAGPQLRVDTDWNVLRDCDLDDESLLVEFTRLFEAGPDGPECPLNGSCYRGGGMGVLEELVRFYDFFGVTLTQAAQGEPDHLVTELEFLHFLSFQETQLKTVGDDVTGLLHAQSDFIERHPGAWVPALHKRLAERGASRFFCELTSLLERFLRTESERLTGIIASAHAVEADRLHAPT